jgi:glycosyltransferase involved in cell wall biosynthesis
VTGPVAILVPVLGRPHRVRPLLDSIAASTTRPHTVVFVCDSHDSDEIAAISAAERPGVRMLVVDGNYARKINAAVRATTEPLVFTAADDLHFHPRWLERAAALMSDTVGVVGTNDLCSRRVMAGEHSTHTLVARWYCELGTIDGPGKLLHEAYPHEFCDDELVATAMHRGAYAHAHDSIVEHLHPDAGKAPVDDLYAARAGRMRVGRRIFRRRQHLWA